MQEGMAVMLICDLATIQSLS